MNKTKIFLVIITVFLAANCRGTAKYYGEYEELRVHAPVASTTLIVDNPEAQKRIMLAFAQGYPDKINSVEFINNDWTMMVNGKRFYYANGRLLPEELRRRWARYAPYDFYTYPWVGSEIEKQAAYRFPVYSVGSSFLFDRLYSSSSESESRSWQVEYSFLGLNIFVHSDIVPLLDSVQSQIMLAARTDASINRWLAEELRGYGWNWRVIANTSRRSKHSYGIALDILPKNLDGRLTYWQWHLNDEEPNPTYYIPPRAVIQAFQDHGFIWGGNWNLIDTMHFEYRPEILILNNLR